MSFAWSLLLAFLIACGIIILMNPQQRQRLLEYSSVVMGSKDVANSIFSSTRANHLLSTKTFCKKNDILNSKYPKIKHNRIKTRNQRPDIFLEGEQLTHVHAVFNKDIDPRYWETFKERTRKSTPFRSKGQLIKLSIQSSENNNHFSSSFDEDNFKVKSYSGGGKASNSLRRDYTKNARPAQASQRHKTAGKDFPKYPQKDIRVRVQQKLQVKKQQGQKLIREYSSQRKQLFYLNQKDMNGIRSESFIVVEYPQMQIVTGSYYRKVVEIASLTKIMTFYAVLTICRELDFDPEKERVQIDAKAADISGTSAELYEGDWYTVSQLFYGLMLPSGNDAATALAKWGSSKLNDGSKGFVNYMNRLAGEIGMKSSTFANPHGLPHSQNGSTAQDVSILIGKCLQHQTFREIIKTKQFRCWVENEGTKRQVVWENTNKLLRRPGFQGVKTGVTATAGPCLATLYRTEGRSFIVVLLRTNKLSRRFKETRLVLSLCLRKLGPNTVFRQSVASLLKNDAELDSDNSEEQQQFNFERIDAGEFEKRRRILLNEL